MQKILQTQFSVEEILAAIVNQDLVFHFHPIVDKCGQIVMYETLTRLKIKNMIVYPKDFLWIFDRVPLPVFYKSLLNKVYSILLNKSFHKKITINISKHEIDNNFFEFLVAKNEETPIDPNRLIIEITENTLMDINTLRIISKIKQELGFSFAIDDFGVGYATLSLLYENERFFDIVKLDGIFLRDLENKGRVQGLFHMNELCQAFGKKTVIEYVDTEYKKMLSLKAGYDYMQGNFFGNPQLIEKYEQLTEIKLSTRTA